MASTQRPRIPQYSAAGVHDRTTTTNRGRDRVLRKQKMKAALVASDDAAPLLSRCEYLETSRSRSCWTESDECPVSFGLTQTAHIKHPGRGRGRFYWQQSARCRPTIPELRV